MSLVIRSNYGNESIALLSYIHKLKPVYPSIYVIYIDTGWAAKEWNNRIEQGQDYARQLGFIPVNLRSKFSFEDYVRERGSFPSRKFQWCAGFLKGIPMLEWLDEQDPAGEFTIAIPKRQAIYGKPISEVVEECEYHGERRVWHPMHALTNAECEELIRLSGLSILTSTRSLECHPCIHSSSAELSGLSTPDKERLRKLETTMKVTMFHKPITEFIHHAEPIQSTKGDNIRTMDKFSMGCGDPFACGL